jgi:hypothetical protein
MEQKFYDEIKNILITARNKVYQTANFAMVKPIGISENQSLKNRAVTKRRSMGQVY